MTREKDPDNLIELTIFEHEFIAQLLINRLAENDIEAEVFSYAGEQLGLLSASTAPHAGAQVRVRVRDYERATAILQEFQSERAEDGPSSSGNGEDSVED